MTARFWRFYTIGVTVSGVVCALAQLAIGIRAALICYAVSVAAMLVLALAGDRWVNWRHARRAGR